MTIKRFSSVNNIIAYLLNSVQFFLNQTGIFKDLNLRVVNISSFLKLREAAKFSKWSHNSWKTHGLWCLTMLPLFLRQNQATIPCCIVITLKTRFYLVNMHQKRTWRRRVSLFDPFSMNGQKAGIHGLVWKMRDLTKQLSPQLNFQYPFPCLLISLQRALSPHMVRMRFNFGKNLASKHGLAVLVIILLQIIKSSLWNVNERI